VVTWLVWRDVAEAGRLSCCDSAGASLMSLPAASLDGRAIMAGGSLATMVRVTVRFTGGAVGCVLAAMPAAGLAGACG
jgi:hypothetical protein